MSDSQILQTPFGAMEYAYFGAGPAILYIHGAGGDCEQAMSTAGRLVATGHRLIAMSRFGYSRTPLPLDPSLSAQADAYASLLDALAVDKAVVIAVSAGAPSAVEFAVRHAERVSGLVLVVPALYRSASLAPHSLRPWERRLLARLLRFRTLVRLLCAVSPATVLKSIFATPPALFAHASAAERSRVMGLMRELSSGAQTADGLELDELFTIYTDAKRLASVKSPTLLISAEDDLYRTLDNARHIAGLMANARIISYRTGGHLLIGRLDDALSAIGTFVRERLAIDRRVLTAR